MLSQWLCDSVSVTRCNGVTCDIALVTLVITAYSSACNQVTLAPVMLVLNISSTSLDIIYSQFL